ncbi:MAG: alginate lyase family protein [Pyrinomonadaceae bacterium]
MISKLKKLKGRSLAEIADRGRQGANAFLERNRLGRGREIGDEELLRLFEGNAASIDDLAECFLRRDGANFYPSFAKIKVTVAALKERFPEDCIRLIRKAERILDGEFELLGFESLRLGGPIPDWHLEPVSGKRSPLKHWSAFDETDSAETGDKKIVWELNRHQYFTTLGAAYRLTNDEKYAEAFASHVEDWILKNPAKMGVNWVSSLEISFRSISWLWAISFFAGSRHLNAKLLSSMLKVLILSGRHIERHLSTYTSPNTHLTGEALGLFLLGSFLPEVAEARRWKNKGRDIMLAELERQVRPDGGHVEQSIHYLRYTADFYLSFIAVAGPEGSAATDAAAGKIRKMLGLLQHAAHPDGTTPLIGDEDGGRLHFLDAQPLNDLRSTIAVGAALLSDEELKFAAAEPTPEVLWVCGPERLDSFDELRPRAPKALSKAFRETGLYSLRTDWGEDASHLLVDCGEHGFMNGAHAHADALGFVMFAGGIPVFVDSGTGSYTGDAGIRDRLRATSAHNCLLVNGESSSEPCGPFSWRSAARSELIEWNDDGPEIVFRGKHDGFERFKVSYEREIRLHRDGNVVVTDEISSEGNKAFELVFVLDPGVEPILEGLERIHLMAPDGKRSLLVIETLFDGEAHCTGWDIEDAIVSPIYGAFTDTRKLRFRFVGAGELRVTNKIRLA